MGAPRQHDTKLNLPTGIYRVRGRLQIQWMDNGKRCRELLKLGTSVEQAAKLRERKLGQVEDGIPTARNRTTFDALLAAYNRSLESRHKQVRRYPALDAAFTGRRAATITYAVMQSYVTDRQKASAADATIHHELTALRAAFRLARKAGLVAIVPDFPMPRVQNVRASYFTVEQLTLLYTKLPVWLAPAAQFAALTGWRRANTFGLTWDHVDFGVGAVRCPIGTTKSGEPLACPFTHGSALAELLRAQERVKRGPWVFHRSKGRKITNDIYKAPWRKAITAMGEAGIGEQYDPRAKTTRPVPKRWHDLRHSFCQHMSDAGVADADIQQLGGWKTRAMLDRYRIVTNRDRQLAAVAQRDDYVAEQTATKVSVVPLASRRRAASR
jgi:integrase